MRKDGLVSTNTFRGQAVEGREWEVKGEVQWCSRQMRTGKLPRFKESVWAVMWIHSNPKHFNSSPHACTYTHNMNPREWSRKIQQFTWNFTMVQNKRKENSASIIYARDCSPHWSCRDEQKNTVPVMRQSLCCCPVSFLYPTLSWGSWIRESEDLLIIQCRWVTRCGTQMEDLVGKC